VNKRIEELIDELIDDTKWAELYPNEKSQRERNATRDKLEFEISKMSAVIESAKKLYAAGEGSGISDTEYDSIIVSFTNAVRTLIEMEKSHE
jgi:hypothetical protein